jgi:hypothetical protein
MASLHHLRKHGAAHEIGTSEIHGDHAFELGRVSVVTVIKATNASDIAQHVDLTKRLRHICDDRLNAFPTADIAGESDRVCSDCFCRFLSIFEIDIEARDLAAFGAKPLGDSAPDS